MNRKLLCFDELIEQVVAVVVMVARGALFDQAACGIADQLGAQGASGLSIGGGEATSLMGKIFKERKGAGDAAGCTFRVTTLQKINWSTDVALRN